MLVVRTFVRVQPMSNASLSDAEVIARLFALKPQGSNYGIDRMRVLTAALGHPERITPCIHIAGTNGKGSVAAMLEAILRAAGWRTGLYTSPHLVHVGERVQVNREALTDGEVAAYVRELQPVSEKISAAYPEHRPSFFELMTAMAFLQFARKSCDLAVIETGLGGRLDATNVVTPQVCAITSIGLDHCEYLGNEIAQIAAEKAGIIKPRVPVVLGRMPREAEKVIRTVAAQIGAPVVSVAERYGDSAGEFPATNLAGEYQRWNAATATLVALALPPKWNIGCETIARGLAAVHWPGRWQRLQIGAGTVILDASHNPEGAETLERNLAQLVAATGQRPIVVAGVLGEMRAKPLLEAICRYASELHLVVPNDPRACGYDALEKLIPPSFTGPVIRDTVDCIFPNPNTCALGSAECPVVVTGSIYLVGEVMSRIRS